MGRRLKIRDDNAINFAINSYMNGMRVKEILLILRRDFEIDMSERTLFRFIIKHCPSRFKATHPNGGNHKKINESNE